MRSFMFFATLVACNTTPEPSAADLGELLASNADLDGNGEDDASQTTIVARHETWGGVLFVRPGPILPGGIAEGQALELRGDGCNAYSSSGTCWEDGFLPMSPIYDDSDSLAWYGVGGMRDGNYEITCAAETAELGTLDGWCLPGENASATDDHELGVYVRDGSEGCWRDSAHWVFRVTADWVDALGYSFAPRDTSCPEE